MTRAARVTDPSYELMDDHNGVSIIYRQHGFPCPNLPHNWISQVAEDEVVPKRDMLVNFTDELFESGHQVFAELKSLTPLLERAQWITSSPTTLANCRWRRSPNTWA
ncbi:hypothetical protein BLL42_26070 [Pseudomonas frederiksbergensis]|uniref:Uncharacterized protein n=1 Tax=Pseudomonas frederiksbergensis TaxID=104087 RepID=A0A1J0ESV8_9PSED|nr:hypothetical protein BLL42_26070 [Pseudomonas frederiksbergensis]